MILNTTTIDNIMPLALSPLIIAQHVPDQLAETIETARPGPQSIGIVLCNMFQKRKFYQSINI
jgi:hypothetical protein